MSLQSIQIERHALSGLLQNQDVIPEIEGFMSEKDFVAQPHATIYSVLISSYLKNEKIDKVILAQKIKNLGISWKDDIDIFSYLESITFTPLTKQATLQACQELVKLRCLRDVSHVCEEIKDHVEKSVNQPLDQTISEIDSIYGKRVNSFQSNDDPKPLFEGFYNEVEERGNNPVEESGLSTPYATFNLFYGGLRRKNLYVIAARAKAGKSTLVADMACEMSRIHNCPTIILDTEMSGEEVRYRSGAAKSEIPLWHLKTGNWRKNSDYIKKVREGGIKGLQEKYAKVYHMAVGNKSIEEVASICRRFYIKIVGRGNDCLIVYDYVKMVGNDERQRKEYQEMGDKIDFLKKLAEELDSPILTACQNNRDGVVGSRDASEISDDERSIGISDRITHFASGVWIFRRRTPEEIVLDTPESGTSKLIEVVCREQGRNAHGHQDLIRRTFPDGKTKYVKNFINFNITNFKVEERGSLSDSISRQNAQFLVADSQNPAAQEETL